MKKTIITLAILLSLLIAEKKIYLGFSVALGGRYDEVRMCAASPAGAKGGIAMEFAGLVFEYKISDTFGIGGYLPIFRPTLFAASFKMLQFMPEINFNFYKKIDEKIEFATHLGIGASFHYGPDYKSDTDHRGKEFFAVGPRVSLLLGPKFRINDQTSLTTGVKPYVEYLISDHLKGWVAGGEVDFQVQYVLPEG